MKHLGSSFPPMIKEMPLIVLKQMCWIVSMILNMAYSKITFEAAAGVEIHPQKALKG